MSLVAVLATLGSLAVVIAAIQLAARRTALVPIPRRAVKAERRTAR